jgi:hypothetical protein
MMVRRATLAFAAGISLLAVLCGAVVMWSDVGVRIAQRMVGQA